MSDILLPTDGSVLILDDRLDHALPLIQLFSKNGISTTYFTGKEVELPVKPVQKIRMAFVDIQLFGPSDSHSYAQNILRILDRIIPENNGPYILNIWSTLEKVHADTLEEQITSDTYLKRPVIVTRLEKSSFFQTETDLSFKENIIEELDKTLKSRFPEDDLEAIKEFLNNNLQGNINTKPVKNALNLLTKHLKDKLIKANSFHLFTIWETLVNNASGEIVHSYSSLHSADEYWEEKFKYSIYRMAHAQLGKTVDEVKENQVLKNALKTMNDTFLDVLERRISETPNIAGKISIDRSDISFSKKFGAEEYKIKWRAKTGKYKLYIQSKRMPSGNAKETSRIETISKWGGDPAKNSNIKSLIREYLSISPKINTRLLLDLTPPNSVQPGNVFVKDGIHWRRRRKLLKNYFDADQSELFKKNENGSYNVPNSEINKFKFIELEVTPLCDYVQGKWRKSRLLPGVLIPEEYYSDFNRSESFYSMIPLIKLNELCYKPIFDFRLLKSVDIISDDNIKNKPLFRVRPELFADILSRLSSHASRVGIAFIE